MKDWVLPLVGFILGITLANTVPVKNVPLISIGISILLIIFVMRNVKNPATEKAAKGWEGLAAWKKILIISIGASMLMGWFVCPQFHQPRSICKYFEMGGVEGVKSAGVDMMEQGWTAKAAPATTRKIAWDQAYNAFYKDADKKTVKCYAEKKLFAASEVKGLTWQEFFYGKGSQINGKIQGAC